MENNLEIKNKLENELRNICEQGISQIINNILGSSSYKTAKRKRFGDRKNIITFKYFFNTDKVMDREEIYNVYASEVNVSPYSLNSEDVDFNAKITEEGWEYIIIPPYRIKNEEARKDFNLIIWEALKDIWNTANLTANKLCELDKA